MIIYSFIYNNTIYIKYKSIIVGCLVDLGLFFIECRLDTNLLKLICQCISPPMANILSRHHCTDRQHKPMYHNHFGFF